MGDLWAQWNEHRIFLARLQFLLDYAIFGGTNVFLFAAIGASCLLLAATFALAVWSDPRDWLLGLGTLAVAGTAALPLAGIENLTLAFNVRFVQMFLFAAVSILAVAAGARSLVTRHQATGPASQPSRPSPRPTRRRTAYSPGRSSSFSAWCSHSTGGSRQRWGSREP